ncbi:MAG TPA: preprotein translocase subunit SecY [Candidatus Polarisedimenticolia bacterium]|nr:preprotein translocase subunit SecY [Candidatus Polarisedimenticolia bacterium]
MAAPQIPNLFKIPELRKKILLTLGILVLLRVGAHITVPGVDRNALTLAIGGQNNLFGLLDLFTGGALQRATVFALGIMPYISASIIFQLMTAVFPYFEKLQKEGEEGRRKITQYTRYATVGLSAVQAYGYAVFIENLSPDAILFPGFRFKLLTVLVLTTGAVFIMWLGEQITEKGIGNGMSLIITFSIIEAFPGAAAQMLTLWRTDVIGLFTIVAFVAIMVALIAGVVVMTMAVRKIPIQIPRKVVGRNRIRQGQKTHLPLRINSAGVMPIIFAQSIMFLPPTLGTFFPNLPWVQRFAGAFQFGSTWYLLLFAALIVFFTYFYTAIIFNPIDLAENMKKQGGFIPGTRPGARTAEYIDHVLTRVTLPGSVFLAAIAIVPMLIFAWGPFQSIPQFIGGTGLLIVVGVSLDTIQQIQSHLILRHYEGFMAKGGRKVRGPRYR